MAANLAARSSASFVADGREGADLVAEGSPGSGDDEEFLLLLVFSSSGFCLFFGAELVLSALWLSDFLPPLLRPNGSRERSREPEDPERRGLGYERLLSSLLSLSRERTGERTGERDRDRKSLRLRSR